MQLIEVRVYLCLQFQSGGEKKRTCGRGGMAVGNPSWELRDYTFSNKYEAEKHNREWYEVMNYQNPHTVMNFLEQGYTTSNSTTNRGPSV